MIVDTREKDSPRFMATLSNWNVNPIFDHAAFAFVPPEGATKINFSQLPRRSPSETPPTRPAPRK